VARRFGTIGKSATKSLPSIIRAPDLQQSRYRCPGWARKKWRKMAVFREAKAPFSRAWSRGFSTQAIVLAAFMSADFFGAQEQEKWRAPFSGEDLFRRDAQRPFTLRRDEVLGPAADTKMPPRRGSKGGCSSGTLASMPEGPIVALRGSERRPGLRCRILSTLIDWRWYRRHAPIAAATGGWFAPEQVQRLQDVRAIYGQSLRRLHEDGEGCSLSARAIFVHRWLNGPASIHPTGIIVRISHGWVRVIKGGTTMS
jgi:hypothetical protein